MNPVLNSDSVKEMFPDWEQMKPGEWSSYNKCLHYSKDYYVEIGLYREPLDEDKDIAGTYTLQIFDGDDVVVCRTVDVMRDYK